MRLNGLTSDVFNFKGTLLSNKSIILKNKYIFIRKYLEISGNACKFQEILGNIRKFQETQYKIWNTRKYFVENMKYFGIFTGLLFDLSFFIDWVLNYFILLTGIYEMSNFMKKNENKFDQKWSFFKNLMQ
jgi:hypothetical protein